MQGNLKNGKWSWKIWTPFAKVWQNIFQYILIYLTKNWLAWVGYKLHQKQKLYREGFASDYLWPLSRIVLEMILKNPDFFETVRKMGYDLEKSGWFWNRPESGKLSGRIQTVYQVFLVYPQKFPDEPKRFRVAMLPCYQGFLHLCSTYLYLDFHLLLHDQA